MSTIYGCTNQIHFDDGRNMAQLKTLKCCKYKLLFIYFMLGITFCTFGPYLEYLTEHGVPSHNINTLEFAES